MKTTNGEIVSKLVPAFRELIRAQAQGLFFIPKNLITPIWKAGASVNGIDKEFEHLKRKLLNECVRMVNKQPAVVVTENGKTKYDFLENQESVYAEKMDEWLQIEIDFNPSRLSAVDLERVENFPISVLIAFQEFELITELKLSSALIGQA
jgi:hypothetical protein